MNFVKRKIWIAGSLAKWYGSAQTPFAIHSPRIFSLWSRMKDPGIRYYDFDRFKVLRSLLRERKIEIATDQFGQGSRFGPKVSIEKFLDKVSPSRSACEEIYRLVAMLRPERMLELGTGAGISTMYIAGAAPTSKMVTVEGNEKLCDIAETLLRLAGLDNVEIVCSSFMEAQGIEDNSPYDFIHIDGDHGRDNCIALFHHLLPYSGPETVWLFDDIRWSRGMHEAWMAISRHRSVNMSLDLFDRGLLFFEKISLTPQHFAICPAWMKPWQFLLAH